MKPDSFDNVLLLSSTTRYNTAMEEPSADEISMEQPDVGNNHADNNEEENEHSHPRQPTEGALAKPGGKPPKANVLARPEESGETKTARRL